MNTIAVIIASYFIAIPLSVVLYELFTMNKNERLKLAALLVVGGIISLILAKVGSMLISDPRPFIAGHFDPLIVSSTDNGFPSDHTLLAAFIGFVMLSRSRRTGILLLVVALAIGLARMYAGVHHSWDVLGSFVITGISYLLVRKALHYAHNHRLQNHNADDTTSK
ncbi:MAG: phosphatase PAP2 family protein [Candidatus Saccharimonadales bacterium]